MPTSTSDANYIKGNASLTSFGSAGVGVGFLELDIIEILI
jgi:hypothetical protein